jgi:hypothetical protein
MSKDIENMKFYFGGRGKCMPWCPLLSHNILRHIVVKMCMCSWKVAKLIFHKHWYGEKNLAIQLESRPKVQSGESRMQQDSDSPYTGPEPFWS